MTSRRRITRLRSLGWSRAAVIGSNGGEGRARSVSPPNFSATPSQWRRSSGIAAGPSNRPRRSAFKRAPCHRRRGPFCPGPQSRPRRAKRPGHGNPRRSPPPTGRGHRSSGVGLRLALPESAWPSRCPCPGRGSSSRERPLRRRAGAPRQFRRPLRRRRAGQISTARWNGDPDVFHVTGRAPRVDRRGAGEQGGFSPAFCEIPLLENRDRIIQYASKPRRKELSVPRRHTTRSSVSGKSRVVPRFGRSSRPKIR